MTPSSRPARRLATAGAGLALVLTAAACGGGGGDSAASGEQGGGGGTSSVTIGVGGQPLLAYLPTTLAQ